MVKEKLSLDDPMMKLGLAVIGAVLVVLTSAGVMWFFGQIAQAETDLEADYINLVAEKLDIDPSQIINEQVAFKDYEVFTTPKGEYKAVFEYEDGKTIMLKFVKVDEGGL